METKQHVKASINLNLLHSTKQAVRITPATEDAHDEMVASIRAHGLLQPLVVRAEGNEFYVVAGSRRYAALLALANQGEIRQDEPINCNVLENGVDAAEASLAENVVRVAMNRADQVEAFARIAASGATPDDIAGRFGVTVRTVERRLRLAQLAPTILELFRAGEITEAVAQAYATTADHERQLAAYKWAGEQYWHPQPNHITAHLQKGMMRSDSPQARFVGMDAYNAAGGTSESTLFEDYSILGDSKLLRRLATEKFEGIVKSVEREWKWADPTIDEPTYNWRQGYTPLLPESEGEPTEEESKRVSELAELLDSYEGLEWEELDKEQQEKYDAAEQEIETIKAAVEARREWSAEQKAAAGVLLYLARDGSVARYEGQVREGDPVPGRDDAGTDNGAAAGSSGSSTTTGSGTTEDEKPKAKKGYSQGVQETVTELRNAVLRDAVRNAPDLAQDLLTFQLIVALKYGYDEDDDDNAVAFYPKTVPLSITKQIPARLEVPGASFAMTGYLGKPKLDLPWFDKTLAVGVLFELFRALPADEKAALTADVCAMLMYSLPGGEMGLYDPHTAVEAELQPDYAARLLAVDAEVWTDETMWARLRKDQILEECTPYLGENWLKEARQLKKAALAKDAATRMRAHPEWLPKGFHGPARPGSSDEE